MNQVKDAIRNAEQAIQRTLVELERQTNRKVINFDVINIESWEEDGSYSNLREIRIKMTQAPGDGWAGTV